MDYDFLVVGAGLSGSTIAERLASRGKHVLVVEKRNHIAGNVYDEYDSNGILVQRYGPHHFHTNSAGIFKYLSGFTEWTNYVHKVLSYVDGKYVPIPINRDTLNILYGLKLKTDKEASEYLERVREKNITVDNAESVVVSKVGYDLYKKMYEGYTKKFWGVDPKELSPEITRRIPVRVNSDDRYFSDIYQAMPTRGYTEMVRKMLSNNRIEVMLNTDYKALDKNVEYEYMVYTGPIDYFYDYKYGRLKYRSLTFEYKTFDVEFYQKVATINYPDIKTPYTRSFEIKHATGQKSDKTTVTYEFPSDNGEPYYPMLTDQDKKLYKLYSNDADREKNIFFVGRLADFSYYNMDQAVAAALKLYNSKLATL